MILLKRFVLMIQFLTTIPIKSRIDASEKDFGKGLVFAPLVGLILGCLLGISYFLLEKIFPQLISVASTVVIYIFLTGGLHLDGLGDTFDGLFSNRPKDRMLEIMRDSRVGTNAVLAIVSLIILNIAFLSVVNPSKIIVTLILMPVAGRIGSLIGAGVSKYARRGAGLGKSFIEFCGLKDIIIGSIIYICIFLAIAATDGLKLFVFPMITAFLTVKYFSRKIDGATGDILGAVCEINQTLFLLTAYLIFK